MEVSAYVYQIKLDSPLTDEDINIFCEYHNQDLILDHRTHMDAILNCILACCQISSESNQ